MEFPATCAMEFGSPQHRMQGEIDTGGGLSTTRIGQWAYVLLLNTDACETWAAKELLVKRQGRGRSLLQVVDTSRECGFLVNVNLVCPKGSRAPHSGWWIQ